MATLSLPTNTPTTDGAVIGCTTDDTTGTASAMVRTDRQWYFEVSANPLVTQAMIDADKATIILQDITASELVWAGTDTDLATIQVTVDGLPESDGPFYGGWVQDATVTNFVQSFASDVAGWTFARTGEQQIIAADDVYVVRSADDQGHQLADWSGTEYSNTSGLSKGVALEAASDNEYSAPRDFSNAAWVVPAPHVTKESRPSTSSPFGLGCYAVIANASANTSMYILQNNQSSSTGEFDAFAYYVKSDGLDFVQLTGGGEYGSTSDWCNYNLVSGTIGNNTTTNHKHSIESVGDGWYKCVFVPKVASATSSAKIYICPLETDSATRRPSWTGDGTSGMLFAHAQIESNVDVSSNPMTSARGETSMYRSLSDMGVGDIANDSEWKIVIHPLYDSDMSTAARAIATIGNTTNGVQLSVQGSTFTAAKYVGGTGYSATAVSAFTHGEVKTITFGISGITGVDIDVDGVAGNNANAADLASAATTFTLNAGNQAVLSLEQL